jgi:carbonic anhydrase/acetyltransferase-like protein (isoleucine patch superfamily)
MTYLSVALRGVAPTVASTAWIAPGAVLAGNVVVSDHASVWYGAVIRAESVSIVLGPESNLQDNCVVHCDPGYPVRIGARVSVGHSAVLHGCTINDECQVGMSATILNGARIGHGSVIAAGAVVLEGVEIPPGSLVAGVPARIRRVTTQEERDAVLANARTYVDLGVAHRQAQD